MSLNQILRILYAWRRFILLSCLGCCVIAVAAASRLPPRYESSARVEIDLIKPDPITGTIVSSRYAEAYSATQAALVRDYSVAGRAVDASGLLSSPQLAEQYRRSGADKRMNFRRWLADQVAGGTGIRLVDGSNILEIFYTAADPSMATAFADLVRSAYIDQDIAFNRSDAERASIWLADQTEDLRQRLAQAQATLTEFERANGVLLYSNDMTFEEFRLQAFASSQPTRRDLIPPLPEGSAAPSSRALAMLEAELAAASQTLGPNHPRLQQMLEQKRVLEDAVARETAALRQSQPPANAAPQATEGQRNRVLANQAAANEARRLAAEVEVLREQYAATATRMAQLRQESASPSSGLTPIGPASDPASKVFPNWWLIVALSAGFGLAFGILTSLLLELLALRVRGTADLAMEDVPVLNAATETENAPGASASDRPAFSQPIWSRFGRMGLKNS